MPGGRQRLIHSLYATPPTQEDEEPPAETSMRRTRTSRPHSRSRMRPMPRAPSPKEDQVAASGDEGDQATTAGGSISSGHEEAATAGGSSSSGGSTVYLRGPSTLLRRPIPVHQRPVIRPVATGT